MVPINLCKDNLIGTKLSRSNDISALTAQLFTSILYIQEYPLPPFACHISRFTVQCFYSTQYMIFFLQFLAALSIKCFVIFRKLCFVRIVVTVSVPFGRLVTLNLNYI